jgi:hypothetical protein
MLTESVEKSTITLQSPSLEYPKPVLLRIKAISLRLKLFFTLSAFEILLSQTFSSRASQSFGMMVDMEKLSAFSELSNEDADKTILSKSMLLFSHM